MRYLLAFISFCYLEEDYRLCGGKIIDKAKNLGNSWYIDVPKYVNNWACFCIFKRKQNSIRFSWKIGCRYYVTRGSSNGGGLCNILGQWPSNKVLFKFKSDVQKKQAVLVDLVKFFGLYHQDVKISQTKLLRSLQFRIVAVYEFFKNKSFTAVGSKNISFRRVSNAKSKTYWNIVKALRKISYYPKKYRFSCTKKTWTFDTNNKKSLLWISTILDKVLQQLLCLVLEPLVELTSDSSSFGFRKHRSAKIAVGLVRSWLKVIIKKHIKLFLCKQRNNLLRIVRENKWVLDADIDGFFYRIHHEYLLANLFLPSIGIFFVQNLLSGGILYQLIAVNSLNSVFQESTLVPVLVNFTLNNLGVVINESVHYFVWSRSRCVTTKKTYLVRYANSFTILCHSKYIFESWVLPKIIQFLQERGLELAVAKTKFFRLRDRSKLKILGYTFHHENKRWIKSKLMHLNYFGFLCGYVAFYPEKFNFTHLIKVVRQIFYKSLSLSSYSLIAKVNFILRGWCYYFNMGNCLYHRNLLRNLLYKMARRWGGRKHNRWNKKKIAQVYFWTDTLNHIHKGGINKHTNQQNIREKRRSFYGVLKSKRIYLYDINGDKTVSSALVYNVLYVSKLVHGYQSDKLDFIKRISFR